MFRELCGAVLPALGLDHTYRCWPEITRRLAASKRRRTRQSLPRILS